MIHTHTRTEKKGYVDIERQEGELERGEREIEKR